MFLPRLFVGSTRPRWYGLLAACCLLLALIVHVGETVIVDGRRKGPSALKNQSHEDDLIDRFNTKNCGISNPDVSKSKFVNEAHEGQFPWLVSFQVRHPKTNAPRHFCMGSFISDRWILSAAHCFANPKIKNLLDHDLIRVTAGSINAYNPNNANFTIKRIFYHSQFDLKNPIGFDVALVEVEEKAELRNNYEGKLPYINSVCLPKVGKEFNKDQAVKLAGWGDTESKDPNSKPNELLTTDLLISDNAECAKIFARSMKKVKKQFLQFKDFLCAAYKNRRDACQGDSGGSLLEFADGKAVAVGIVSYGLGCATPGVPGVYERVSSMMPWIKEITSAKEKASVYYIMLERGKDNVERKKSKEKKDKDDDDKDKDKDKDNDNTDDKKDKKKKKDDDDKGNDKE